LPHALTPAVLLAALALLAACRTDYSPDTYATRAVQQANKVEQGTVIGRRDVAITAEGSTGAATGAAAGGVLGAQAPGGGIVSALGGVGGALIGGVIGKAAEHTVVDAKAFEYVVRNSRGELVSVTQRDTVPLAIGQRVLVIAGNQARIVPDYTTDPGAPRPQAAAPAAPAAAPAAANTAPAAAPAPGYVPPPVVVPPPPPPEDAAPPPSNSSSAMPLPPAAQGAAQEAAQGALPPATRPVAAAIAAGIAGPAP
jgi:outer membrane lipoprotein SlyB